MPTAFVPAFPHDHTPNFLDRVLATPAGPRPYLDLVFWISFATLAGLPATTAPVGLTRGGLPVGIQIVGPYPPHVVTNTILINNGSAAAPTKIPEMANRDFGYKSGIRDHRNIAPRAGFSWNVGESNSFVIRGGRISGSSGTDNYDGGWAMSQFQFYVNLWVAIRRARGGFKARFPAGQKVPPKLTEPRDVLDDGAGVLYKAVIRKECGYVHKECCPYLPFSTRSRNRVVCRRRRRRAGTRTTNIKYRD